MSFDLVEYLKGPELVVKFQEFFGVHYINTHENDSAKPSQEINETQTTFKELSLSESQNIASKKNLPYRIDNKFWYYLFLFGTELGDEIFYSIFIPCWFWNVDSAVGRRVIFLWSIVMYIGQSLKDIIRWQRPGRPVYQLQKKWSIEYGMPSTHAMVAVSIPFSVLIFTQQRYIYPAQVGLAISILWCAVVCLSRIYLGMHSVLDVIAGIVLTFGLMIILVPLVDYLDIYIVTSVYSPIFVLYVSIFLIYCYPQSKEKWTPTRGDTTMTISVCAGLQIGAWVNYQMGYMNGTPLEEPHIIIWPTFQMWGHVILRTFLGLAGVVATRFCAKYISYYAFCAILGKDQKEVRNSPSSLQNKIKTIVELGCKYFTYGMIGFNIHFSLANAFKLIGIARPDFYTEI